MCSGQQRSCQMEKVVKFVGAVAEQWKAVVGQREPKEAWSTHSSINDASSEVTLGKEMVADETYPEEERTSAGEA